MHHGTITKPIAHGLDALRARIDAAKVPSSKLDESITLATWNVRELGKSPRMDASLHYIAEIVGQFDLVSIVEVRDDLTDLTTVLRYLGPYWRVVFSDYLLDAGGNRERIAYVYDSRAVTFTGLASQAVGPRTAKGTEYAPDVEWWRPPYVASFRAGSFDFILVAAHIRWGASEKGRVPELRAIADWVESKHKQRGLHDNDIVVVGDFNVPRAEGPLYEALTSRGLRMPPALAGLHGSDLAQGKRYDQILYDPRYTESFAGLGGVLDFYAGDHRPLYPGRRLSKQKFTFELSDHLPLWMQVNTAVRGERLEDVVNVRGDARARVA